MPMAEASSGTRARPLCRRSPGWRTWHAGRSRSAAGPGRTARTRASWQRGAVTGRSGSSIRPAAGAPCGNSLAPTRRRSRSPPMAVCWRWATTTAGSSIHNLKNGAKEEYRGRRPPSRCASAGLLARRAVGDRPQGRRAPGRAAGEPPIRGARATANARAVFDLLDRPPQHLVFSPGGEYLAACTEEIGAVRVWRIAATGLRRWCWMTPRPRRSCWGSPATAGAWRSPISPAAWNSAPSIPRETRRPGPFPPTGARSSG